MFRDISIYDYEPEKLACKLRKLAGLVNDQYDSFWLRERAEAYLNHHAADPAPWPPPVALDRLWVDLDYGSKENIPIICMPEYRKAPGEKGPLGTNTESDK